MFGSLFSDLFCFVSETENCEFFLDRDLALFVSVVVFSTQLPCLFVFFVKLIFIVFS